MSNPLSDTSGLPRFHEIEPAHAVPALQELIAANRRKLAALLATPGSHDFASLVHPLEEMNHELDRVWSPVRHLQGVLEDPAWRDAYNECLALMTEYGTEMSHNKDLQQAYQAVADTLPDHATRAMRMLLVQELRDFRLAGVALPDAEKARFGEVMQALAAASASFEQNVQDATDAWHYHATDAAEVAGLPQSVLDRAALDAQLTDRDGWWLSLDFPTYHAVMSHAEDRSLREKYYRAWSTLASDRGDHAEWDNSGIIESVLALRHEAAQLAGFRNYAEYSLATKMAGTVDEVLDFLTELARKSRARAESELEQIAALADHDIQAWDVAFYLERLKIREFAVSDEELRQYFPAEKVLAGLFRLAKKLYGISVTAIDDVAGWHETVQYYEVRDGNGRLVGSLFTDLYARKGKRSGAWMDECVVRKQLGECDVPPVGYLVCNFPPPDEAGVSMLTHTDVVTLFHEFGHILHHLLTRVDYPSIAGINGVPWDAVELPSQFMENYAWHYDVLKDASAHRETGEPLPREIFQRLEKSRFFGAALAMLRQLEFALFDFRLHAEYDPQKGAQTLGTLESVRAEIAVVRHPAYNRSPNSFGHIFAGGYAAGYYSYKWAEVLAADAFAAFRESGIFDRETATRFRSEILEVGGSRDFMEAYVAFRGRKPTIDALLRQSGIEKAA